MALVLTEEQGMLRDSARAFLADNAPVAQLRQLRYTRDPDGFSRTLWGQFAEMGFTGVLGQTGAGWAALDAALNAGRAAAAAELLGLADEAFARTVAYLKERRQFNRVIGEFQALQHRVAHLYCEIEFTRSAVLKALQGLDEASPTAGGLASVAKAKAGTTATLAVQEAVQLHGGMGMTDEFEIGFFMKRARVLQELFGDANYHADLLAQMKQY